MDLLLLIDVSLVNKDEYNALTSNHIKRYVIFVDISCITMF